MRILLFTDGHKCKSAFAALGRSRKHSLEIFPTGRVKTVSRDLDEEVFVYLDVTGLSAPAIRGRIKTLTETVPGRVGIVDLGRTVTDVAEIFHRGAVDFVGADLPKSRNTASRFDRVVEFSRLKAGRSGPKTKNPREVGRQAALEPPPVIKVRGTPSGPDWSEVVSGDEYIFQILFIGLDHAKEMGRKSSEGLLRTLRQTLQGVLTTAFSHEMGRVFVWKEDCGVLLAPYDGECVTALLPAIRMVLNRTLITIEQFTVTTPVSWRMGLHVGNIVYRDTGRTSSIVSETLNFIFHLGERAIQPGELVVTWPALASAPGRVQECFVRRSDFEGTALYRMKNPV